MNHMAPIDFVKAPNNMQEEGVELRRDRLPENFFGQWKATVICASFASTFFAFNTLLFSLFHPAISISLMFGYFSGSIGVLKALHHFKYTETDISQCQAAARNAFKTFMATYSIFVGIGILLSPIKL